MMGSNIGPETGYTAWNFRDFLSRSRQLKLGEDSLLLVPVAQDFSPLHVVQTGSGAHPASYPMGTGGLFPWG
jgi:hypothetical protein